MDVYCCDHSSAFIFDLIFLILASNKDNHKSLDEFDFRQDLTSDCGVRIALEHLENPLTMG